MNRIKVTMIMKKIITVTIQSLGKVIITRETNYSMINDSDDDDN